MSCTITSGTGSETYAVSGRKKWEADRVYKPKYCPEAAWKTLIEHWSTEEVMAEAEKMKKARAAVKNPSHVGRGGRK
jgi:hypothetical protein